MHNILGGVLTIKLGGCGHPLGVLHKFQGDVDEG